MALRCGGRRRTAQSGRDWATDRLSEQAVRHAIHAFHQTRLELLFLPTYTPWTNPIEKLWRWLYQDVLHLHSWADDWTGLQAAVSAWLSQFQHGSLDLLRYVGLYPV
ncbi:MAG: transposase [Anaerolineae bacterium]|nr:transposase [Anaerolineae bacterium]